MQTNTYLLNGKPINLAHECKIRGMDYNAVHQRILTGKSVEEALSKPTRKNSQFTYLDQTGTLRHLINHFGWNRSFITNCLYIKKMSLEEAVAAHERRNIQFQPKVEPRKFISNFPSNVEILTSIKLLEIEVSKLRNQKKELNSNFYYSCRKLLIDQKEEKRILKAEFNEQKSKIMNERRQLLVQIRELKSTLKRESKPKKVVSKKSHISRSLGVPKQFLALLAKFCEENRTSV